MNITIRTAYESEAKALSVVAIESKHYWSYPKKWFDLWRDMFTVTPEFIKNNNVWVAEIESSIVGFIAISIASDTADLEHMWVLPEFINEGVGRSLFLTAVKFCRTNGVKNLKIESDPNATGFYEKMGAIQVGFVDSIPEPRKLPVLELML